VNTTPVSVYAQGPRIGRVACVVGLAGPGREPFGPEGPSGPQGLVEQPAATIFISFGLDPWDL